MWIVATWKGAQTRSINDDRGHAATAGQRRLRAFVTRVLAEADAAGFTRDELSAALAAQQPGGTK